MPDKVVPKLVDLDNARLDEQRQVMQEIVEQGHCPFCPENIALYHKQPMLREGKFWFITANQWPYEHTQLHLLIIYRLHAVSLQDLDPAAGAELVEHIQWIERTYGVPGGGVALRFGDSRYSAGTVAHLHVQFVVPNLADPQYQPVRIKIGKNPVVER